MAAPAEPEVIRKGKGEYDSITFNINQWGDNDKIRNTEGKKLRGRFWAPLKEVNQIIFEPYIDFSEL